MASTSTRSARRDRLSVVASPAHRTGNLAPRTALACLRQPGGAGTAPHVPFSRDTAYSHPDIFDIIRQGRCAAPAARRCGRPRRCVGQVTGLNPITGPSLAVTGQLFPGSLAPGRGGFVPQPDTAGVRPGAQATQWQLRWERPGLTRGRPRLAQQHEHEAPGDGIADCPFLRTGAMRVSTSIAPPLSPHVYAMSWFFFGAVRCAPDRKTQRLPLRARRSSTEVRPVTIVLQASPSNIQPYATVPRWRHREGARKQAPHFGRT